MLLWTLGCTYPFEPCFSPDICPGVGLLDHMLALFLVFSFLRNLHTVVHSGCTIYVPTKSEGGFSFLHTLSSIYFLYWYLFNLKTKHKITKKLQIARFPNGGWLKLFLYIFNTIVFNIPHTLASNINYVFFIIYF